MNKLAIVAVCFLIGCGAHSECDTSDASNDVVLDAGSFESVSTDAGPIDPIVDYDREAREFAEGNGLSTSWVDWMIEHKADFEKPYRLARTELVRGRPARTVLVNVWYDNPVEYNPPWQDEKEHFLALERLLMMQFPGWTFEATESRDANIDIGLGHRGNSSAGYASGVSLTGTKFLGFVYLNIETIASHELAHVFGFKHHEPDGVGSEFLTHPEEGKCVMGRNSMSFGPIETFVLKLEKRHSDEEISPIMSDISSRYPD